MNLIDGLQHEIVNDDSDHDRESDKLISWYGALTVAERAAVSEFCVYICGWSMLSLREKYKGDDV